MADKSTTRVPAALSACQGRERSSEDVLSFENMPGFIVLNVLLQKMFQHISSQSEHYCMWAKSCKGLMRFSIDFLKSTFFRFLL